VWIGALDDFSIELQHQAQYAMGRWMLRPEVHGVIAYLSHP